VGFMHALLSGGGGAGELKQAALAFHTAVTSGTRARSLAQLILRSSTSKMRSALGGMTPPAPAVTREAVESETLRGAKLGLNGAELGLYGAEWG